MSIARPIDNALAQEIIGKYLSGVRLPDLCATYQLPRLLVYSIIDTPEVRDLVARQMATLGNRALMFKLSAFDHAEECLERLAELAKVATDESLKRKCNLDIIRLASLEPKKVIVINKHIDHGLTQETQEFISEVMNESGFRERPQTIDAEVS